jgi:hypothetical protein
MTEVRDALKKLGWSEDLIQAFTMGKNFPAIESAVTYSEPTVQSVDTTTLVVSEASQE